MSRRADQLSLLRRDLAARSFVTCANAMNARDKAWVCVAGLVLVASNISPMKTHAV